MCLILVKKEQRICKNNDFKFLYSNGIKLKTRGLTIYYHKSEIGHHMGIVVSRKIGNAVVRNKFKRRIRAWFPFFTKNTHIPYDIVVVATHPTIAQLGADALMERMNHMLIKLLDQRKTYEI